MREVLKAAGDPRLFLDLKLHDIPNTVGGRGGFALRRCRLPILTIHASGGPAMLRAAKAGGTRDDGGGRRHGSDQPRRGRPRAPPASTGGSDGTGSAPRAAERGTAGLDGIGLLAAARFATAAPSGPMACSSFPAFVRRAAPTQDQKRTTLTPAEARAAGADILVVGRPITQADDPAAAAKAIADSL